MGKSRYKKILKHLKSEEIDLKIQSLNEKMTTSGLYPVYGFDSGTPEVPAVPEIPAIPAVPPTYDPVDPGGISNPDDFVWPSQGDGSDPNTPIDIPTNLYTTYNGEQVAAIRQIEGEYPQGVMPLAYASKPGWLGSTFVGYFTANGFVSMATVGPFGSNADTPLKQAYYSAWFNWPYAGKVQKTIYVWEGLDCLLGTCRPAAQYYPANLTYETTPKATYGLYPITLHIPVDENGNVLANRVMTDPGSPEVPAVPGTPAIPAIPPKPVLLGRTDLGDPNYYPGPAQPQGNVDPMIAQMGPNQVYPLLDIVRQSPPGPTRNNAIRQLDQWAKPGSKNRDLLIKLGVPLEGASTPTTKSFDISKMETDKGNTAQLRTMGLRPDGTHGYSKPGDRVHDPASGKTFEVKMGPSGRYQWMKV